MKQDVVGHHRSKYQVEGQDDFLNGSRRTAELVGDNGKDRKHSSSPK